MVAIVLPIMNTPHPVKIMNSKVRVVKIEEDHCIMIKVARNKG